MSKATSAVCGVTMLTPLCGGISGLVTALSYGGPGIAVWGWLAVAFFTINVALGMAECASAYPTAGGMYHWRVAAARRRLHPSHHVTHHDAWRRLRSRTRREPARRVYILTESVWATWTFGWMELLGQIASVSAVAFVWAAFAQEVIILATTRLPEGQQMVPGTVDQPNQLTQDRLFALYTGALFTSGIVNSINARVLDWMTVLCAWFCLAAIAVIVIVVPCVAPTHQSASWVFGSWAPTYGRYYLGDKYTSAYSAIMALLMPGALRRVTCRSRHSALTRPAPPVQPTTSPATTCAATCRAAVAVCWSLTRAFHPMRRAPRTWPRSRRTRRAPRRAPS